MDRRVSAQSNHSAKSEGIALMFETMLDRLKKIIVSKKYIIIYLLAVRPEEDDSCQWDNGFTELESLDNNDYSIPNDGRIDCTTGGLVKDIPGHGLYESNSFSE